MGENEDTSTDYEYWNIPREIEESSASEEECTALSFASERADKQLAGSSSYEDDYQWLYFSHTKRGWMCKICEVYPYSGGSSKGAFSTRPCLNTSHPNHVFKKTWEICKAWKIRTKIVKQWGICVQPNHCEGTLIICTCENVFTLFTLRFRKTLPHHKTMVIWWIS